MIFYGPAITIDLTPRTMREVCELRGVSLFDLPPAEQARYCPVCWEFLDNAWKPGPLRECRQCAKAKVAT